MNEASLSELGEHHVLRSSEQTSTTVARVRHLKPFVSILDTCLSFIFHSVVSSSQPFVAVCVIHSAFIHVALFWALASERSLSGGGTPNTTAVTRC